ncbi:hypothetical protein BIW11_02287 [Tropilaelaps mercedesae]|uniref:Uncharacterized protein n=1 Tax=Tropilaelaps mercedesae TaxID=418985 RepID=A0A1V9X0C2_9ACAR|nr:hypothetical protein BIW11_02287 [Tropilaelaps mercedesae]
MASSEDVAPDSSSNSDTLIWAIKNGDLDTVRDFVEHKSFTLMTPYQLFVASAASVVSSSLMRRPSRKAVSICLGRCESEADSLTFSAPWRSKSCSKAGARAREVENRIKLLHSLQLLSQASTAGRGPAIGRYVYTGNNAGNNVDQPSGAHHGVHLYSSLSTATLQTDKGKLTKSRTRVVREQ